MKNWICIENFGTFDPMLLSVYGLSSKRDDNASIGRFGSGTKIAAAHMLRNNIPFYAYSGEHEIRYSFQEETFYHSTETISTKLMLINGQRTSLSIDMVPDWKLWFDIREVWANALDESEAKMYLVSDEELEPKEGYTRWYLDYQSFKEIYDDWDIYYHNNPVNYQTWPSKDGKLRLYKQGFLAFESHLDGPCYNLDDMNLTELREMKSHYNWKWDLISYGIPNNTELRDQVVNAFIQHDSKHVLFCDNENYPESLAKYLITELPKHLRFYTAIQVANKLFIDKSYPKDEYLIVPKPLHEKLAKLDHDRCFWGRKNKHGEYVPDSEIVDVEYFIVLEEAKAKLIDFGLAPNINKYPVKVVRFEDENILALAHKDVDSVREIWLSEVLVKDIENVNVHRYMVILYEEYLHLENEYIDLTRKFQDFLINQVVRQAKNAHYERVLRLK